MHTAQYAVALLLVTLAQLRGAAAVQAETVACTAITTVPTVITVQGIYCFTGHLNTDMTSGNAIAIQTNSVILDLNGFKLGGLAAGLGTTANGLFADNRQNITIKNGTIRGFQSGIVLLNTGGTSQGHVIEDMRADQHTLQGLLVQGDGTIVRNHQVVTTGGATCCGADVSATGITVAGSGPRVLNNDVINTVAQGSGIAHGIFLSGCTGCLAVNNRITQADRGIAYAAGSTGKYRDNITSDVTTPFLGGTDIGNNN